MFTRFSNGSLGTGWGGNRYLNTKAYSKPGSGATTTVQVIVGDHGFKNANYTLPPRTQAYEITLYLCAQRFPNLTADPRQLRTGTVDSEILTAVVEHTEHTYYRAASTGEQFFLDSGLEFQLFARFLPDWLNGTFAETSYGTSFTPQAVLGDYLLHENLESSFSNITATLSSLMRSDIHGDNLRAAVFRGDAFVSDPFFHVRWAWLTVILVEVGLTAVLLSVTVARSIGDPVLKTSNVALLVYGLNGWTRGEAPVRETQDDLIDAVDGVSARLEYREDDGWGFEAEK